MTKTKYEQMCEAAKNASQEFQAYRQRALRYYGLIIGSLQSHCGVPATKIVYLKWNGQQGEARKYLPTKDSMPAWPGAIEYDTPDGFWHLGVRIILSPNDGFSEQWITFALCIKEQNKVPTIKFGINGRERIAHLENELARNQYCEMLSERIVQAFSDPTGSKEIGFVLGTSIGSALTAPS